MNEQPIIVVKSPEMGFNPAGMEIFMSCGAVVLGSQNLSRINQQDACGVGFTKPGEHVPDIYPNSIMTTQVQIPGGLIYNVTKASYDAYVLKCNGCCTPLTLLATPANYTGSNGNTQSVQNWDDVTNATGYVVERALNNSFTGATVVYTGSVSGFTNTGLTNGTTYYYRVKATAPGYRESQWAIVVVTPAP